MAAKMARVAEIESESMITAPGQEIPSEIREKASHFIDSYVGYLRERTDAYLNRMAEVKPEAGEPNVAGYQYWNALTVGPIQFSGNPPYNPSKIIAAGEPALMLGTVWINPTGGVPATVVLGARPFRIRFETINLSTVSDGPDFTTTGVFTSPAPTVSAFPWFFVPSNPGLNPNLFETYFSIDITTMGQPFAAFGTWHFDTDIEPPFLGLPPSAPHFEHSIPAQYMVYQK